MKILTAGMGGCGSRVVQMILKRVGMDLPHAHHRTYDYRGLEFIDYFDPWFFSGDESLEHMLRNKLPSSYAVKQGLLMLCPEAIEWMGCKYIYMLRNPLDTVTRKYSNNKLMWHKYGDVHRCSAISERIEWAIELHVSNMERADHVIHLERLCADPEGEIGALFNSLGIDADPLSCVDIVKQPATLGYGSKYYPMFDLSSIGY